MGIDLLPPAYVVRREGNSFTLFVSPHLGGGVRSSRRGGGGSGPAGRGGVRSSQWGGGQGGGSGPAKGGGQVQPVRGGSGPANGGGGQVQPAGGGGGGVRSSQCEGGQHLAPSCGRYLSCVHAGGLSCYIFNFKVQMGQSCL